MNTILVPTDFSLNANKALDYAVEIARRAGASIVLMHNTDSTPVSVNENPITQEHYEKVVIDEITSQLETLVNAVKEVSGVHVVYQLFDGFVPDAITAATQKNKADLVVMGTLGNAGVREKLFGSITASVIGHSTIPVLAIPLMAEPVPPASILLAVHDFREHHDTADAAFYLAELFRIPVHVTVYTDETSAEALDYLENKRSIENFAREMQQKHPDLVIEATPVYGKHFEEAIKDHIAGSTNVLLVMLTHKRNFIESLFHRSITKKMSYHTNIPLLSIPIKHINK